MEILGQFGPKYPDLKAVEVLKFRRAASGVGSVAALERAERQAYGAAVETAIRALQRQELRRVYEPLTPGCASGTFHNDGRDISRAVRAQNVAEARRAALRDRSARTPEQWKNMYAKAMAEKRA